MRYSLLLPVVLIGLAGCVAAPPDMTTTTYNPATITTTRYASPAVGAPYVPTGTSTTYAAPGYMAPSSTTYVTQGPPGYVTPSNTSTTYVTPGPGYMAPGNTTTVVRTP